MRVLISADAEGVTGITNTNELLFGRPHYEFMRTMMTDDVNAAIEGAFAGGATEVVVNDAHWTMTNIQIERLDPRADLIKGFHKHLCMVEGVQDADAVFFLGYHARTGDSDGVGNETILGREIVEIRMNGKPVGESEINAAVCGEFGVPVIFASGDDAVRKGVAGDTAERGVRPDQIRHRPLGGTLLPACPQPCQHPRRSPAGGGAIHCRGNFSLQTAQARWRSRTLCHVLLDCRGAHGRAGSRDCP